MSFEYDYLSRLFPRHNRSWLRKMWSYTTNLNSRLPSSDFLYQHLSWLLVGYDPASFFLRGRQWIPRVSYRLSKIEEEVSKWHKIKPNQNHIRIHPFPVTVDYPFQQQHAFGITVAIRPSNLDSFLSSENLEQAISGLLPNLDFVDGSIVSHRNPATSVDLFYCEVKKREGKSLSIKEKQALTCKLPGHLERYLRPKIPPLIVSHNEEEVLKGIVILSQELTQPDDIPQLILRFHQAESDYLFFTAILVRFLKPHSPSVESLEKNLPVGVSWEIEKINEVGFLEKIPKEAISLTLRFPHKVFQIDGAVDLRKARQFTFQILQDLFGKIRDYNGGWMSQQAKILDAVKKYIDPQEKPDFQLLERFFYSLTPRVFQSYVSPELLANTFSLVNTASTQFIQSPDVWQVLYKPNQDKEVVIVLTKDPSHLTSTEKLISPLHHSLASARFSYEGVTALVMINLQFDRPTIELWITAIENALKNKEEEKTKEQVLRLSIQQVIPSLDPRLRSDRRSGPLMNLLYEGLMRLNSKGQPISGLAEKVDISSDGCHYTFHLRKTYWSNGKPVTAHDFKYGWEKVLEPAAKAPFSHLFYCIKGARLVKEGKAPPSEVGISVKGNYTLTVVLEEPSPHFLAYTTFWSFSPLYYEIDHLLPQWAFDSTQSFPCNGPFMPAKLESKYLELVKNPNYRDKSKKYLDKISIYQAESYDEAIFLWKQGYLDWIGDPLCPILSRKSRKLAPAIPLKTLPTMATCSLYLNTQLTPFSNVIARQQVAKAIYEAPELSNFFPKGASPTSLYIPPAMGLKTKLPKFPNQTIPLPASLRLSYPIPDQSEEVCQAVAQHLEKIFNITVTVQPLDWENFYIDGFAQHGAHMGISIWYPLCLDPMCYLDPLASLTPANISQWQSPLYNQLLQEANTALTPEKRLAVLSQAETVILKNAPIVPLYRHAHLYAKKKRIKGAVMIPTGTLNLRDAYV